MLDYYKLDWIKNIGEIYTIFTSILEHFAYNYTPLKASLLF